MVNSLVNIFAKPLVNMFVKTLLCMLATSLKNIFTNLVNIQPKH